jgi:phosphopantothenate---cysteine ligase (CTP)
MNVLVTGGGTSAPIDDVRTITNVSSGRFAASITESCLQRDAQVWHLHAPSAQLPLLRSARFDLDTANPAAELDRLSRLERDWKATRDRLHLVPLRTGTVADYAETLKHVLKTQSIDVAFLAMAVSDYEPTPLTGKVSSEEDLLVVRCHRTPKVIRFVRDWSPSVYLVGFKLLSRVTTAELIRQAGVAGRINRADLTVANDLQSLVAGQHTVHLVRPDYPAETLAPGPDLADRLVSRVLHWANPVPAASE